MPMPCLMLYVACTSLLRFQKASKIHQVGLIGVDRPLPHPLLPRLVRILLRRAGRPPTRLSSWLARRSSAELCYLGHHPLFLIYWGILSGCSSVSAYEETVCLDASFCVGYNTLKMEL